ncbi:carboxypeptidase-like regulatory domain-containing protein [Paludibaculum fermentans]|uniref:Carboxypeptidase regulatory-like domain-containing protein n=1 Tax=Paludibaculum fermentans TaxID=1473598 RepID=A0A7S7SIN3_PALFE|nr:carboxypeptidase-like regulatory domain-containing protein [Paludibaculum fermentans]QOY87202.1 carboxypeptidase regulatory-like domain-containing protein [Paludibaculum fermentans]
MRSENTVFVARVIVDSGEGRGSGPARVVIEEPLWNVPQGLREVDVDTMAGTTCYRRLKTGERYVVFAGTDPGPKPHLSMSSCSKTFSLAGNEYLLNALRVKALGGPSRLVGKVSRSGVSNATRRPIPGVTVIARSSDQSFETITDNEGRYELRALPPGFYQLEVSKPGFLPDEEYNNTQPGWPARGNASEPFGARPAPVSVPLAAGSCEVWDLALWPRGRISGQVSFPDGQPVAGILVQAVESYSQDWRKSKPMRTARTDAAGRYLIEPLPGSDYVVSVDPGSVRGLAPSAAVFFTAKRGESNPAEVHVKDNQETTGVNITLPPPH